MRQLSAVLLALAVSFGMAHPLDAARDLTAKPISRLELLVIEVAGCTVCELVRSHIQPAYEASPHARRVPMRYVDITSIDELALGLETRVSTVPTIVLMRDGKELDRISGYTGPTNFFAVLTEMLQLAAE